MENKKETNEKINKDIIHKNIEKKLEYFIDNHKIPHIIFYGKPGSGKRYILHNFINKIYENDKTKIKEYVMWVNCAHCKGIRFIRDELKFFAKRNIQNKNGKMFKSIVLFDAEKLTTDAQSALRRCIETFSHNTRFFIIVQNIDNLLSPILSRFCNIYIPYPKINNKQVNLSKYKNFNNTIINNYEKKRNSWLKNKLNDKTNFENLINLNSLVNKIYDKGYSNLDIMNFIKNSKNKEKHKFLFCLDKIRKEFRNEKLFMFMCLHLFFMRKNIDLENIFKM